MKPATPSECFALVLASLVLIIVLVMSFMCIQLFTLKRAAARAQRLADIKTEYILGYGARAARQDKHGAR
jgi:hypothetical protein